jgi:hypothetical protein
VNRIVVAALAAILMGQASPRASTIDRLGWMSGAWETGEGGTWTEEVWSRPRAGRMIGFSRSGKGDRQSEFEFVRLEPGRDGIPVYLASRDGGSPIPFRLTRADSASATFENPAHDFPQRIAYRRQGERLIATISALDGSRAMSWSYRPLRETRRKGR